MPNRQLIRCVIKILKRLHIWWLQSVYVLAEYRQQGVFRSLFRRLADEAEQNPDVVGLRLYVEHQNDVAQATYQKLGFEPGGYHVMQSFFKS